MDEREGVEALNGEIIEPEAEPPREGTAAWLALQEHVFVEGLGELPGVHRLDLDAGSIFTGEDDGKCRYVRPDGKRCGAHRMKAYGVCVVHAGGGGTDLVEMRRQAGQVRARLKASRVLLGIGPKRSADPRQLARLRAAERAEEIAAGLLSPLDDGDLSPLARQASALRILDATFPQQVVSVTVDVPADAAGVQALGWAEMQALAAQLLGDTSETQQLEPA